MSLSLSAAMRQYQVMIVSMTLEPYPICTTFVECEIRAKYVVQAVL